MKNLLIMLFSIPLFVLSQTETASEKNKRIADIRNAAIVLVEDYKSNIKVSSRNEDDFYDLFCENEKIINDIIPSPKFGEYINATDWIDLFKGNRIYSVDIDILELSSISEYDLDSGFINVIIKKDVRSAMWNASIKENFGIDDGKVKQNVNFNYSNILVIKIGYRVNYNDIPVKIISIEPFQELTKSYVLVPKSKPRIGGKPRIFTKKDLFKQKGLDIYGDNIPYFFNSTYNNKKMNIDGYLSPKEKGEGFVKDLVYIEKLPVTLSFNINLGTKIDYGNLIVPTSTDYQQKIDISASLPLFAFPDVKSLIIGAKISINNSETSITNNQSITSYASVDNAGYDYTRINTITDYNETLLLDQRSLFVTLTYDLGETSLFTSKNKNKDLEKNAKQENKTQRIKPNLSLLANGLLGSINTLNSNRTASALYSAQYGPDLFNILIEDNVDGEDFGSYFLSENEDIEINHNPFQIIQIGIKGDFEYRNIALNLGFLYSFSRSPWLSKQYNQISSNNNEFNSIVLASEFFSINYFQIAAGLTFKL